MLADRKGRRGAVVGATALFGIASLATALATNVTTLMICRFITGVGLAGALGNSISLVVEYSPKRIRASVVSAMFCAFPLGGAFGGMISAKMIQAWGWPSVFWLGGVLPTALATLLAMVLPESTKFLVATGADHRSIAAALNRFSKAKVFQAGKVVPKTEDATRRTGLREILSEPYAFMTVSVWIAFGINQLALTFTISWMPLVMRAARIPLDDAISASVLFILFGIIGAMLIARLSDRKQSGRPVVIAYLLSAVAVSCIGYAASTNWLLLAAVSAAGFFLVGVAVNLNPIAASVYPTNVRSTGVGWSLGVKSVGGVVGALAGSLLISSHVGLSYLYLIAAAPITLGAASLFRLLLTLERSRPPQ